MSPIFGGDCWTVLWNGFARHVAVASASGMIQPKLNEIEEGNVYYQLYRGN